MYCPGIKRVIVHCVLHIASPQRRKIYTKLVSESRWDMRGTIRHFSHQTAWHQRRNSFIRAIFISFGEWKWCIRASHVKEHQMKMESLSKDVYSCILRIWKCSIGHPSDQTKSLRRRRILNLFLATNFSECECEGVWWIWGRGWLEYCVIGGGQIEIGSSAGVKESRIGLLGFWEVRISELS